MDYIDLQETDKSDKDKSLNKTPKICAANNNSPLMATSINEDSSVKKKKSRDETNKASKEKTLKDQSISDNSNSSEKMKESHIMIP